MKTLFDVIKNLDLTSPLLAKKGSFVVEETLGTGLLFATEFKANPDDYAIVASNQYSAQRLYEFLLNFLEEEDVVFFPNDELLRADSLASSRELLAQRLYALGELQKPRKKILVTHPSAILRFLPNPARFAEETIHIKVGETYNLSQLKQILSSIGYEAQNKIEHSLQFASRGDILDIYSVSYLHPLRIEFFGDEVESIRTFDLSSQESKDQLKECVILPASDIFLNDDELSDFAVRAKANLLESQKELPEDVGKLLSEHLGEDLEEFVYHNYKSSLYKYYGFALGKAFSVLNYFSPKAVYITNQEQFVSSCTSLKNEAHEYFGELFYKARAITGLKQYMEEGDALHGQRVIYSKQFATKSDDRIFSVHKISAAGKSIASIAPTIQSYLSTCKKVILALPDPRQRNTVEGFLEDLKLPFETVKGFDIPKGNLAFSEVSLSEGFEIPETGIAYLSSSDLFGNKGLSSRFTSRFKDATILRSYEDLKPGDYVVHEYNGIGQFLDIKTILVDGVHRDFLHVAYAGNEYLYIPLEQFRLVRKYAGREGATPKLSHLSTGEWSKRKAKIKERINELADRLIALYGDRTKLEGCAFPPDDELQFQFENEFPHPLTPDQEKAVAEIKADMEKPEIMDRLLCGDVGFGKTEVAFRAAFKAISSGKQVAILCPTTLLARQHYEVATDRFAGYGVKMALLSRLVPDKEQNKAIEGIASGSIHMVIGTHRLLSKEIEFKDLGLLIVDEEQRFGVEQKERIKEMKRNVDVLTLSATPIPRTLQMSLVGIRPLSEINTAPSSRMPIQTYVTPFKEDVVVELIQRELARKGQVFYVHNKVATIYNRAAKLARAVPSASIGVIHGQMDKNDVEDVMSRFYDGDIDVLVCTSIVENGIDIPNANMIIVEEADHFGLSQLYQIKGRVGRGNRIAYAYLMYKPHKEMREDAVKRLKAIQEFTELGSGYKIAQRDLMIRGAGDILGPEQAGFIDSVGLDLYLKLLNEAVEAKKTGFEAPPPVPKKLFNLDAYIPQDYADKSDKLELYQSLEEAKNEKDLLRFQRKIRDIYGRLPEEVELLIGKKRIDLLSEEEEFVSIDENKDSVNINLSPSFSRIDGIGNKMFNELVPYLSFLRVIFVDRNLRVIVTKREDWLRDLETVMKGIHKVYEKMKSAQS